MFNFIYSSFWSSYFLTLACVAAYMTVWFVIGFLRQRNDVADEAWGLGFVFVALLTTYLGSRFKEPASLLVLFLVAIWGLRLFWHISRRHNGHGEDPRYVAFRNDWTKFFYLKSYVIIYLFQGLLLFLVSTPVILLNLLPLVASAWFFYLGLVIWLVGFYFEVTADAELKKFIANPKNKGKLMTEGLWKLSRHPNYFGEVTMWWGIFLIALSATGNWWTIVGPITISYLIVFVSGVPLLEKKYAGRPDWEEYKKKTSVLIPLPPKK